MRVEIKFVQLARVQRTFRLSFESIGVSDDGRVALEAGEADGLVGTVRRFARDAGDGGSRLVDAQDSISRGLEERTTAAAVVVVVVVVVVVILGRQQILRILQPKILLLVGFNDKNNQSEENNHVSRQCHPKKLNGQILGSA